jgi:hypothetical protein
LALVWGSTGAAGNPPNEVTINKSFDNHPLRWIDVDSPREVSASDIGARGGKCGGGKTTKDPLVKFKVESVPKDIVVRVTGDHVGVILNIPGGMFSSGSFICKKAKNGMTKILTKWAKETYEIHVVQSSSGNKVNIDIEDPSRLGEYSPGDVKKIAAEFENPWTLKGVKPGTVDLPASAYGVSGSDCKGNTGRTPHAVFELAKTYDNAELRVTGSYRTYLLLAPGGGKYCSKASKKEVLKLGSWKSGIYKVFAIEPKGNIDLEFKDSDRQTVAEIAAEKEQAAKDAVALKAAAKENEAAMAAMKAAGYDKPTEIKLSPNFEPNPMFAKAGMVMPTKPIKDLGINKCTGFVTHAPIATVSFQQGQKLSIGVYGTAKRFLAMTKSGSDLWCGDDSGATTFQIDSFPAEDVLIYAGAKVKPSAVAAAKVRIMSLLFEQEKRDRSFKFDPAQVAVLDKMPKKPLMFNQSQYANQYVYGSRCSSVYQSLEPVVVLDVQRPLKKMEVLPIGADKDHEMVLVGPIETARKRSNLKECLSVNRKTTLDFKMGKYVFFGAHKRQGTKGTYGLNLFPPGYKQDPYMVVPIAGEIPMGQRSLQKQMPFLGDANVQARPEPRLKVFLTAPKELFSYVKFDLDDSLAQYGYTSSSATLKKGVKPIFPKKDEPVLIWRYAVSGAYFITMDGNMFGIDDVAYLESKPSGAPALVKSVRNTKIDFNGYHNRIYDDKTYGKAPPAELPKEEKKAWKSYQKTIAQYQKCSDKVWKKAPNEILSLKNADYLNGRDQTRLDSLIEKWSKKEEKACKPKKLNAAKTKYFKAVYKYRESARKKGLKKIAKRLKTLLN